MTVTPDAANQPVQAEDNTAGDATLFHEAATDLAREPHSGLKPIGLRVLAVIAAIAVGVGCSYAALAWDVPFFTKGEPREAIVVQAIASGETVMVPLRNGDEIPSKPPMFHWLGAAAAAASGGVSELSTRVPSILGAAGCVAFTGVLGARLYGLAAGVSASLLLASAVLFLIGGTRARVDMTLAFFVTAGLYSFASAYLSSKQRPSHWFYLACALAVLAKGPVGAILPAGVIAAYLIFVAREPRMIGRMLVSPGLLWFGLPVAWYVAAYGELGQAFLDTQLFRENLYRIVDAERDDIGHAKAFWVYLPYLMAGFAPWSLYFPALGRFLWQNRYRGDQRATAFLLLWALIPLLLFSLAGSKRPVYLLPAYPAIAVLLGLWWSRLGGHPDSLRASGPRLVAVSSGLLVVLVGLPTTLMALQALGFDALGTAAAATDMSRGDRANLQAIVEAVAGRRALVGTWACATLLAVIATVVFIQRGRVVVSMAAAVLMASLTAFFLTATFRSDVAERQTTRDLARQIAQQRPDAKMYSLGEVEYATIFYVQRPIRPVQDLGEVENLADSVVFVREPLVEAAHKQAADSHRLVVVEIARHIYAGSSHRPPLIALRFQAVSRPVVPSRGRP